MTDLITLIGLAQSADGAQSPMGGMFVPIILMFAIFYFILLRPQQKKAKEHQNYLDALERGTEVVTSSGIIGKVTGMTKTTVTLEVAPKVKIKVTRSSIAGNAPKAGGDTEENK